MGRSKNKKVLPLLEKVLVEGIGAEGKAIARVNEMVIFVSHVVPGDVVDLQITKKHRRYLDARVVKFHHYSDHRAEPFCEHFGVCGGCKWQQLPYESQLNYKQQQVIDSLERLGHLTFPTPAPILGSIETKYYRNKLEFTFSNKRWLTYEQIQTKDAIDNMNAVGFHIPRMFDKILDITTCHLQKDPSNAIRNSIRDFAEKQNLSFFDIRAQVGFLRNLIIRTSSTRELMVILSFFHEDERKRVALLEHLKITFPQITSLMYVINEKKNDTIGDQAIILFSGRDYIEETMEDIRFKIGPKSFYQTNSEQAYNLYKVAREFAELEGDEIVYDLYTGTGTIAHFVSKHAKKVIGIEYVPEAIEDARVNARINGIENTFFFAGDMKDVLNEQFIKNHGSPDVIIVDPPRAGMHDDVIKVLLEAAPPIIVYVSCNPATQARDVALMSEKYQISQVQAVDMFPHTHHVENVLQLKLHSHT